MIRVFIQARMSSKRFPGKVLAPLNGRPLIARVIEQVALAMPLDRIVVATSIEQSDDPLACYSRELGVATHRGELDNVFERLRSCLRAYPCSWFFRISADSPLLNSELLRMMLSFTDRPDVDLVTNVQVRTFPKGHSVELLKSETFAQIDDQKLSAEEREHLTKFYYNHPTEFRIINIESSNPETALTSYTVDTLEDLRRLEEMLRKGENSLEQTA